MNIIPLELKHYDSVSKIYIEGLATGIASFETQVPTWEQWNTKFLPVCRLVVEEQKEILAWCGLSLVSKRIAYKGVAETTIYVSKNARAKGIGRKLLSKLIIESEKVGFWTLQASIFRENTASLKLHQSCGFRVVGIRKKIAQRAGVWHDNILLERRTKKI